MFDTLSLAFIVVFAIFLVAIFVWAVLTVRWALRRDREQRMSQGSAVLEE